MEEIIASITAAGPNPDKWPKNFVASLRATPAQTLILPNAGGMNPLVDLDPEQHSLGYACILAAQLHAEMPPHVQLGLLPFAATFTERLSREQLMQAPEKITAVGRGLLRVSEELKSPMLAVRPLLAAIKRFAAHAGHLTPLHHMFLRACLQAKLYKKALELLDMPLTDVEPVCDTRIQDFLLYHYYAAMIYEGVHMHARALDSLAQVITAPSQVTSSIQIEAYKKFVLVSLRHHGKVRPLPKYMAACVGRAVKGKASAYTDLATAYESGNVTRLRSEYQKSQAAFGRDRNDGLAKQLLDDLWKRNVAKLTQTYVTLSVEDISKQLGIEGIRAGDSPDIEKLLQNMVTKGEIDALLDQKQGMVEFRDPPAGYDDEQTVRKLNEIIERSMAANESIVKMDRQLGLSRDVLARQLQGEKSGGGSLAFGAMMDDEVRGSWAPHIGYRSYCVLRRSQKTRSTTRDCIDCL